MPLLIHSMAEFRQLIFGCFEAAGVRRIIEIGGEDGTFTRELLAWGEAHGATVVCIDPSPRPSLERLEVENDRLLLVRQLSTEALDTLEPGDAYLIDGDHNYFTVHRELQLIVKSRQPDQHPVVFLHDVGWPCGRRDMYYDPDSIPPEFRHDYTWDKGVVVGNPGVVAGGFRGEGEFAAALEEGGGRNGVLTAVEDFLADRPELRFDIVPAVFGLGVIHHREAPYANGLAAVLDPYVRNELLQRLEDNRLALYLAVLDRQDLSNALVADRDRAIGEMAAQLREQQLLLRDAQVENRALWRRVEQMEGVAAEPAQAASPDDENVGFNGIRLRRQLRQSLTRVLAPRV